MTGWGLVAGVVVAYDVAASRRHKRMLSHVVWDLIESNRGWFPFGVAVAVSWHLLVPRRPWVDAVKIGTLAAAAHRVTVR